MKWDTGIIVSFSMDSEKVLSGLIGGAVTGVIALGGALVNKGRREEQFDRLRADMANLEKSVSEKVPLATFEKEIEAIHVRMSRTQREQAAAIDKLDGKVDRLSESVSYIHGVVSQIPAKLESLSESVRNKQNYGENR